MLTQDQYNNLWIHALGLPLQHIPCYYQYLQREVYQQDYLDLFDCPHNLQPTFTRQNIEGVFTVSVPFEIRHMPGLTVQEANEVKLIVDYDFPFYGHLCEGRTIRRILIGEAAPSPKMPRIHNGRDKENSYFYNIKHINSSLYLNAPCRAFGINVRISKTNKLIHLANYGVLLIDLSPFAVGYSENTRPLIAENLLTYLRAKLANLLPWDVALGMIAPEFTSVRLLELLADDQDYVAHFQIPENINNLNNYESKGRIHVNYTPWPHELEQVQGNQRLKHLSKNPKLCVAIGGNPHWYLIHRCFNLGNNIANNP